MLVTSKFVLDKEYAEKHKKMNIDIIKISQEEGAKKMGLETLKHYPFKNVPELSRDMEETYEQRLVVIDYEDWLRLKTIVFGDAYYYNIRHIISDLENKI